MQDSVHIQMGHKQVIPVSADLNCLVKRREQNDSII